MSAGNTQNTALAVVLSIFGVLAVSLLAGLLLMQKQETGEINLSTALSSEDLSPSPDDFDPISWVRGTASYPPLQEIGDTQTLDLTEQGELAKEPPLAMDSVLNDTLPPSEIIALTHRGKASEEKSEAMQKTAYSVDSKIGISLNNEKALPDTAAEPVKKTAHRPRVPKNHPKSALETPREIIREVSRNAFWVQIFSSSDVSRAEEVREQMSARGMPSMIQVRKVSGETRYRVRIGAFGNRSEAENYAMKLRVIPGFESSYVLIAPYTQKVSAKG